MTTMAAPWNPDSASEGERHQEGIWGEEMTQDGLRRVTFRHPLPMQLIGQYAQKAARHGLARQLEDGHWFAEIEGFLGVWAEGESQKEALDELESVVEEWVLLKIRDCDRDIPVLESLDLNEL